MWILPGLWSRCLKAKSETSEGLCRVVCIAAAWPTALLRHSLQTFTGSTFRGKHYLNVGFLLLFSHLQPHLYLVGLWRCAVLCWSRGDEKGCSSLPVIFMCAHNFPLPKHNGMFCMHSNGMCPWNASELLRRLPNFLCIMPWQPSKMG